MRNLIMLTMLMLFVFLFAPWATAGSGQVAKKDQCHWDRSGATPERHRHIPETKKRGWICKDGKFKVIKGSGAHKYVIHDKHKPAKLKLTYGQLAKQLAGLKAEVKKMKTACVAEIRQYRASRANSFTSWKTEAQHGRKVMDCMDQR